MPIFAVVHDFIRQELKLTFPAYFPKVPKDFPKVCRAGSEFAGEITKKTIKRHATIGIVFRTPFIGEDNTLISCFIGIEVNVDDIADTSVIRCRLSVNTGKVYVSSACQNFGNRPFCYVYTHENHLEEREKETSKHPPPSSQISAELSRLLYYNFRNSAEDNSGQYGPEFFAYTYIVKQFRTNWSGIQVLCCVT
jgi:hypothetical protein